MPYCAPSVNGAQCQGYSWLPSVRGAGWPAQPGISSLVRRGCKPELTSLNLTSCIAATPENRGNNAEKSLAGKEFQGPSVAGRPAKRGARYLINVPACSSSKACCSSALVFMTIGPYQATGSRVGFSGGRQKEVAPPPARPP